MHVVENMLVMFHGFISSISNDISNQNALYNFNFKKNVRLEIIILAYLVTKVIIIQYLDLPVLIMSI